MRDKTWYYMFEDMHVLMPDLDPSIPQREIVAFTGRLPFCRLRNDTQATTLMSVLLRDILEISKLLTSALCKGSTSLGAHGSNCKHRRQALDGEFKDR